MFFQLFFLSLLIHLLVFHLHSSLFTTIFISQISLAISNLLGHMAYQGGSRFALEAGYCIFLSWYFNCMTVQLNTRRKLPTLFPATQAFRLPIRFLQFCPLCHLQCSRFHCVYDIHKKYIIFIYCTHLLLLSLLTG